jgi:hypothetical protein
MIKKNETTYGDPQDTTNENRANLNVDRLEPRILLSATWVDAIDGAEIADAGDLGDVFHGDDLADTADGLNGDDQLFGHGGDDQLFGGNGKDMLQGGEGSDQLFGNNGKDTLQGGEGDDQLFGGNAKDQLEGGAGDDLLDGGLGVDTADYSNATSAVTVDLTLTGPQDTGGAGTDTLISIEGVVGSEFDDTFALSNPTDGATYTIDGGNGTNAIDLSNHNLDDVSLNTDEGSLTVDLGDGESFTVKYSNVDTIQFGDTSIELPAMKDSADPADDFEVSIETGGASSQTPDAPDVDVVSSQATRDEVFDSNTGSPAIGDDFQVDWEGDEELQILEPDSGLGISDDPLELLDQIEDLLDQQEQDPDADVLVMTDVVDLVDEGPAYESIEVPEAEFHELRPVTVENEQGRLVPVEISNDVNLSPEDWTQQEYDANNQPETAPAEASNFLASLWGLMRGIAGTRGASSSESKET